MSQLTISNPPIEKLNEINNKLSGFAAALHPSSSYVAQGNAYANAVFRFLQQHFPKISKTLIGGSMGKDTALDDTFNPDYDLVFLINDEEPPFNTLIKTIGDKLKTDGKKISKDFIYQAPTKFSLKFEIGVYKFDLLPGCNLAYNEGDRKEAQFARVMAKIRDPEHGRLYSSSLIEHAIHFVRDTTPFVKQVIRLAKYWNKCVPIEKNVYIPGRSTIIELVVIHANTGLTQIHLLTGFKRFLKAMVGLKSLNVKFNHLYSEVPASVRGAKCPRVFDPANPYNNIAQKLGEDEDSMNKFIIKARETFQRLDLIGAQLTVEDCIGKPYQGK